MGWRIPRAEGVGLVGVTRSEEEVVRSVGGWSPGTGNGETDLTRRRCASERGEK